MRHFLGLGTLPLVEGEVRTSVEEGVRTSVEEEVRTSVEEGVRTSVEEEARTSVEEEVRTSAEEELRISAELEAGKASAWADEPELQPGAACTDEVEVGGQAEGAADI